MFDSETGKIKWNVTYLDYASSALPSGSPPSGDLDLGDHDVLHIPLQ